VKLDQRSPLFVDRRGDRIKRGGAHYLVERFHRAAGLTVHPVTWTDHNDAAAAQRVGRSDVTSPGSIGLRVSRSSAHGRKYPSPRSQRWSNGP